MSKPNESKRRFFSPADKMAVLKRHLLERVPVSDLCDELGIAPNLFYCWRRELFENGHAANVFDKGCLSSDEHFVN